jgi:hypothetical protein
MRDDDQVEHKKGIGHRAYEDEDEDGRSKK